MDRELFHARGEIYSAIRSFRRDLALYRSTSIPGYMQTAVYVIPGNSGEKVYVVDASPHN